MSTVLGWSADDQLAAVTSVLNEIEACPGCGLRPDQFPHVNVALHHCPGCEARTRSSRELKKHDLGVRTVFETVADARDSLWAKLTSKGAQWAARHRDDPEGVQVADPDLPDG